MTIEEFARLSHDCYRRAHAKLYPDNPLPPMWEDLPWEEKELCRAVAGELKKRLMPSRAGSANV